ncbi:urease accessory protein UreH domain-containing protein [Terrisporobacter vanillatitrophus]|uniref:urease accessory protein UreH domain-containing protein n=1 Tax=Terrisporobacter vanillatitrophus TaxID=3058402 RepID=UPI003369077B
MSKITKFFHVYGMKCHSCEVAVEEEINKLQGIINIKADHNNSMVIVTYENGLCNDDKIKLAIKNSGFSSSNNMLIKVLGLSIIIISMFFLGNNPLTGSNTSFTSIETSFIMLFVLGFFTSFHCVGMCGGILLTQTINKYENIKDKKSSFKIALLYNSGRIISYTIIGGIVGALGSIFSSTIQIQNFIKIIAGVFMIISGLHMIGIKMLNNIRVPIFFKKSTCVNNHKNPFIVGYLSGFLPCGPLKTMQLYALSSGSFIMGASSMFVFSLGTLPIMLSFAYISSRMCKSFNERIYKYTGILIVILGILMLNPKLHFI